MAPRNWWAESTDQQGAPGMRALVVSSDDWEHAARELAASRARLLAMWASHSGSAAAPPTVHAAYLIASGALLLHLPLLDPEIAGSMNDNGFHGLFPQRARRGYRLIVIPPST